MSQGPLVYLPIERWSELQSALKSEWPRSISAYALLETQKTFMEQGFDYGFKVYCPYGDVWNGMVAINVKKEFYEVIVQCPQDDTKKLQEALRETQLIDWNRFIIVPYAPYNVLDCLHRLPQVVKMETVQCDKFILHEAKLFEDVSIPPNLKFDMVSEEHLDLVDSTWPHRYPNSTWYYKLLINAKTGFGLYEGNQLISWVFFNETGNLLHLYTIESYRKRGYAELVLKLVSNILLRQGKPVIVYCVKDNVNAYKMYVKLGFLKADPNSWCYLTNKYK